MYFYLGWINKRHDKIVITDEMPNDINYESKFRVKGKEYTLCCTINEDFITYYPAPTLIYKKNHNIKQTAPIILIRIRTLNKYFLILGFSDLFLPAPHVITK